MTAKNNKIILIGIVTGFILGIVGGVINGPFMLNFSWMGEIFLSALKMLIVPLIMLSMISGVTSLGNIRKVGAFGGKTVLYYTATTALALIVGLILVNIIQPGTAGFSTGNEIPDIIAAKKEISISDVLMRFISPNIFESMVKPDLLPLILFSLVFGGVLSTMEEKAGPVIEIVNTLNAAVLKIIQLILWLTPFGVFGLIAKQFGEMGSEELYSMLLQILSYVFTVLLGLAIHAFVVLPAILYFFTKRNPFVFARNTLVALFTAFSTASSSATLPLTIECSEKENGVSPKAAGFVLPLGATINMDGTALYEAVAALFIAQVYGLDLSLAQQALIFLTATLASIGAAGIPQAGLFTMTIVLTAVGLPLEGTALLLPIDPFLDRFRTTVNVWGDSVGAAVMEGQLEPKGENS